MSQIQHGHMSRAFARLGEWTADHRRLVLGAWAALVLTLGALAPFAEGALSGAGWEASGSESVHARDRIESAFPGRGGYGLPVVVASDRAPFDDPAVAATIAAVRATLRSDPAVGGVVGPRAGRSVSRDRRTVVVLGLAGAPPDEMVEAAGRLKGRLAALSRPGVTVRPTGPATMWSDFNSANRRAMLRAETLSWPLTLGLLVLAFGTLIAAGLPLLLTFAGLAGAGGGLFLVAQHTQVSIWAMNFAMMFAIGLGIDYALFIVVRFRAALATGADPRTATAIAMASAGKAVFVSGLTVLAALLAVMLVPVPTFRSVPLGIVLAVVFVLGASLTLLPALLSTIGGRIDAGRVGGRRGVGRDSARFAAWGRRLRRRPVPYGLAAVAVLLALAAPVLGLRTGMPSIRVVPEHADSRAGQDLLVRAFGPGAAAQLQVSVATSDAPRARAVLAHDPGIAAVLAPEHARGTTLLTAIPRDAAATQPLDRTIDRLRSTLPRRALVGGAVAESRDLERALLRRLVPVYCAVLGIGFLLLLVLLRAPVAAAVAVLLNLLSTAATFGVARLVFQDGALGSLFGGQGFVDAWAPIFFFALAFALAMDYTVFLLATVKENIERDGDHRQAVVDGLARTGPVINAAAGVMVVVFLTFAMAGPIPLQEMGLILAVAVALDATLVRLLLQPVALLVLGRRAWWAPAWLDRRRPRAVYRGDADSRRSSSSAARRSGVPAPSVTPLRARESSAIASSPRPAATSTVASETAARSSSAGDRPSRAAASARSRCSDAPAVSPVRASSSPRRRRSSGS
jgi:RND superfamily putative drug exporter